MRILIDADACPVVEIATRVARKFNIGLELYCDTNHVLFSDYGNVHIVGAGADAVDFKLVNDTKAGDIVVTQDYGLAAMVLGKKAYAIHQNGKWYTDDNIGGMLEQRAFAKKLRRASSKAHLKGPAKRTAEDDQRFEASFTKLVEVVNASRGCSAEIGTFQSAKMTL